VQRCAQDLDGRDLAGNRAFAFGEQTELGNEDGDEDGGLAALDRSSFAGSSS